MNIKPTTISFRVGKPIQDPDDFVGRKEILGEISRAMLNFQNISLHGERRTGKTSLLLYLANPASASIIGLPEKHIPVYFNFQDFAEAGISIVWQAMAESIAEHILQRHPDKQADTEKFLAIVKEYLASPKTSALFGTGFGRALTHLDICGFKIHLLLDEFEKTAGDPELSDSFYDALRSLPVRAGNVSYVIATRTGLAELQPTDNKFSSPLFNIFSRITLGFFQEDEVYRLIFGYFAKAGLDISHAKNLCAESSFLYDITGYHPCFLQMLCYHMCSELEMLGWPGGKAREQALKAFETDSESHFEYYWEISSKKEQELIKKLASSQSVDWSELGNRKLAQSLKDRCLIVQTGRTEHDFKLFSSCFSTFINREGKYSDQIFISCAKEDLKVAEKLYKDISRAGVKPWMESKDILPGQQWRKLKISRAIKESSYFLVLLSSNSVSNKGVIQKEIKTALDLLDESYLSEIVIIPIRLDDCKTTDEKLKERQWVDIFPSYETGLKNILDALVSHPKDKLETLIHEQVPFINREQELNIIDRLTKEWGTRRILCVKADGGIGKTRLLQEVRRQQYTMRSNGLFSLIITDIIDFDNHTMHIPSNLGRAIGEMLDKTIFKPYLQVLNELREMEEAGISGKMLARKDEESEIRFAECFNTIGGEKRIVLYMDTTDALEGTDVLNYLIRLIHRLENMLLLIAGRNTNDIKRYFEKSMEKEIRYVELQPLTPEASKSYLQKKQTMLNVSLEHNLAQNLILLADGRPILLDLAIEWLIREVPLEWLAQGEPEEMKALSDKDKQKRREEFESRLVQHIADTRRSTDWLILLISLIYPLDTEMIAELLEIGEDEAKTQFEEVRNFVFVKELPDGRISLHDEMRRMVAAYVWPRVDPEKEKRREYLDREIQLLTKRIDKLREEEKSSREQGKVQAGLGESVRQLEQRRWSYRKALLDYTPIDDIPETVNTLAELFDETTQIYRFSLRETLINKMEECINRLSPDQISEWYKLNSYRVKYLYDKGEYKTAKDLVTDALGKKEISPEQRFEMLIQSGNLKIELGDLKGAMSDYSQAKELIGTVLEKGEIPPDRQVDILIKFGNIDIRLGNLHKGIDNFEKALHISKEHDFKSRLVQSLNARGWAFRNIGNFDHAVEDYREAYLISLDIRDYEQTVQLENNMGLLYALKGKHQTAFNNCQNALELCKNIGFRREMGMTYSTLGRIYELSDQTDNALSSYEQALTLFQRENDIEWISRVRCNRASVYLSQKKGDEAEADLEWAINTGPKNLVPRILFFQSMVHRNRNELNMALEKMKECQTNSREIGDSFFDYVSFSCLIELAWELYQFDRWQEFNKEHERYADRKSEMDLRLRGTSLRRIGDLAICNKDYDAALDAYKKGLTLITEYEVLKRYTIEEQIRTTKMLISKFVEKEKLSRMGNDLETFWKKNRHLIEKSPETLLTFQRWGW